jgi:hypothetical protein
MKTSRLALACGAAAALTVTACGSSPPAATGTQAASDARAPVAEQYWSVLAAIYPDILTRGAAGRGSFSVCPAASGQQAKQISYDITVGIAARDEQLATGQFVTQVEQALQAKGWGAFAPYQDYERSAKDGYHVYLQQQAGGEPQLVMMTVGGPCVNVGSAYASAFPGLNDQIFDLYPFSAVSARPTPTQPLPSP